MNSFKIADIAVLECQIIVIYADRFKIKPPKFKDFRLLATYWFNKDDLRAYNGFKLFMHFLFFVQDSQFHFSETTFEFYQTITKLVYVRCCSNIYWHLILGSNH